MRSSNADRTGRLRAGGLTVDLGARQAHVDDRLLELTALEFDLLGYLVARPGQVFSRDELLRAVWRSTEEWQQPATVTEHIRRLRTKIETEPHHPRILRTVRGAGYRLDIPEEHDPDVDTTTRLALGTLVHIDGRIVQADQAAVAMFDLDDHTPLVGRQISELRSPVSRAATREHVVTGPDPEAITELIDVARVDATAISLQYTSTPVEWHGRRAQHLTAAWRCAPSPGGGASAVNETNGYRALFQRAPDAGAVADDDRTHVHSNPAAVRTTDVDRDDRRWRRLADFVDDEVVVLEHRRTRSPRTARVVGFGPVVAAAR